MLGLALLARGHYLPGRAAAALAVAAILWAWGVAQYPDMLVPGTTVAETASNDTVLTASLTVLGLGSLLLIPSLWLLYATFQRKPPPMHPVEPEEMH